ncbi:MAG: trigger factor [Acutalibacteraceae bacterium]|nr:trigger factor [Acutalibacteraceae bacterium]
MLKSANKTETNIYTLEVAVSAEDFKAAILKAYNKQKNKIQLPGFRKGKAPLAMIEKFYGKEVFYEDALDIVYPTAVGAAIEEAGIDPVAAPHDVEVVKMDETGVELTFKITVMPEITIDGYKGIEADKGDASVTADDVKKELASMQERNSRTVTVEDARKAKKNDIAVIDFEGFVDGVAFDGGKGENFELTLGSGQFIPGFEDQVIGKKAGEEFDVNVTFPTEYAAELAGKDATFKVKIHELKVKELPTLDDEFAKDVSEYDTLAELKKSIKADLVKTKTEQINREFESNVLEKVVELVEGEIPEVMYDNKLEDDVKEYEQRLAQQGIGLDMYLQYMGMDKDAFKESMRANAVKQVKLQLAIDKIAELEKIEATDEDADAKIQEMADMYQMEAEKIKQFIRIEDVKKDVIGQKTVDFLVANAKAIVAEKPKKTTKKAAAKKTEEAAE